MSDHPFKRAIRGLLSQHFADEIASRFQLLFEWEKYNDDSLNIWKQKRDDMPILELYYQTPGGITVYVTDLFPWDSRARTEVRLLKMITDKVKTGQFGADWEQAHDGRISQAVTSGKYETPNSKLLEGTQAYEQSRRKAA